MADLHDFLEASLQTDAAIAELAHLLERVDHPVVGQVVGLGALVITRAIREYGTRFDYVARDLDARANQ